MTRTWGRSLNDKDMGLTDRSHLYLRDHLHADRPVEISIPVLPHSVPE